MVEAVIEDKSVVVRTASATPAPATATQNPEAVRRVYMVDDDSMVRRSLSFTHHGRICNSRVYVGKGLPR